jgi:hypothetical protein
LQQKFLQSKVASLVFEDQVSVFTFVSQRLGGSLAPGSLFVSRYVSQGYGGGILMGLLTEPTKYYYSHTKEDDTRKTCRIHGTEDKSADKNFT